MKHIGSLINTNPQETHLGTPVKKTMNPKEPTSSISREINPKSKLIETLFSKFAAFYGHIWRSQFKSEAFLEYAKKEWQDGLNGFSENTINKAIIQCRDFYELPPSFPQMI